MVTGWEEHTSPLTKEEREIMVPYIVGRLSRNVGEKNAVKAAKIIEVLNEKRFQRIEKSGKQKTIKVTGPRFRQMIHHIRVNSLVPHLVANRRGYYVAESKEEVERYIRSLIERRNSFEEIRRAMQQELSLNPPKV